MRYLMNIAYDGTDFNGWQSNPNGRAVQDIIENALGKLIKKKVRLTGASRTDSGVHALDQYAHFDHERDLPFSMLFDGMNSILPQDVRIKGIKIVDMDFHSRYKALFKIYAYIITNCPVSLPIMNRYSLNIRQNLNINKMKQAICLFKGHKDFTSFRASGCCAKSPIITVDEAEVLLWNEKICLIFKARSFLQHMIRNIAGALVHVGLGKISPSDIEHLFNAKNRKLAPPTAKARGLFLVRISYGQL